MNKPSQPAERWANLFPVAPCACPACASGEPHSRDSVAYDGAEFCTSHPDFVSVCEWGEELSGYESVQLKRAVAAGLVKRGRLEWLWCRDGTYTSNAANGSTQTFEEFCATYPLSDPSVITQDPNPTSEGDGNEKP